MNTESKMINSIICANATRNIIPITTIRKIKISCHVVNLSVTSSNTVILSLLIFDWENLYFAVFLAYCVILVHGRDYYARAVPDIIRIECEHLAFPSERFPYPDAYLSPVLLAHSVLVLSSRFNGNVLCILVQCLEMVVFLSGSTFFFA